MSEIKLWVAIYKCTVFNLGKKNIPTDLENCKTYLLIPERVILCEQDHQNIFQQRKKNIII